MEQQLISLINECKEYLDKETINEVMHFYEHDEYEMALEGLVIELMKIKGYPSQHMMELINMLVFYYRLNVESVFDYYFWDKYKKWVLAK